jgi:aldehyde:ferredoxin oxidoreductase
MHEPRLKPAMGVGYAVSPTGADHMINIHDTDFKGEGWMLARVNAVMEERIGPLPLADLGEEKMQVFYHEVNFMHFQDCAMICFFYCYDYHHLAEALSGVTGEAYSVQDIMDVGARAQTLARLFNQREGFTAEDDRLPERVMTAFTEGPLEGIEITQEAFDWAKRRYYELMGWDPHSGQPTAQCLRRLGLDEMLA